MCTLTLITGEDGYLLGMNRDERLSRGDASSPECIAPPKTTAIYPRDGEGGTWIAANNHGIALALLNWNDVPQPRGAKTRSRGEVIPAMISAVSSSEVIDRLWRFDSNDLWPFRLVGVFAEENIVSEWRWDGRKLESQAYSWEPKHWFSSSMSDAKATGGRGAVCEAAWKETDAGSVAWLRRLHASHENGPGPFSLCVHRENVGTLSYTEVACNHQTVECAYFAGSPCSFGQDPIRRSVLRQRNS